MTHEDRKELLSILEQVYTDARKIIENDRVLPSSITFNGEDVGVTIELRKVYKEVVSQSMEEWG